MTTRKILTACMLMLAVTLAGCAYTTTSDADQQSLGFDATAVHPNCPIGKTCPHNPADCTMSKEACDAMQKKQCEMKKAECEAKQAECEAAEAKPCCNGSSSAEG